MRVGNKNPDVVQLKFTLGMKGLFPCHVKIFDTQEALSEDKTIPATILENDVSKSGIIVFDRGVQSRERFRDLAKSDRLFVTRLNLRAHYRITKQLDTPSVDPESSVTIEKDMIVRLKPTKKKWQKCRYRLVQATIKESGEKIYFLTNIIEDMTAYEIAYIYKQRWAIEPFIKFLKQHLNLTHLISRNKNGIRVMIFMTLILSILLIAYKNLNKIESYKRTKLRFALELEAAIVKQIVILSGGNLRKVKHFLNDA
jgi:IS4 transposase